jgi:hypothetical protein
MKDDLLVFVDVLFQSLFFQNKNLKFNHKKYSSERVCFSFSSEHSVVHFYILLKTELIFWQVFLCKEITKTALKCLAVPQIFASFTFNLQLKSRSWHRSPRAAKRAARSAALRNYVRMIMPISCKRFVALYSAHGFIYRQIIKTNNHHFGVSFLVFIT